MEMLSLEELKHAAELASKSQIEQMEKWRVIEEVKRLIIEEINIAHFESQATSRLTAIWNKLETIK